MSKLNLFVNRARVKYYARMAIFCCERANTTDNSAMCLIWTKHFNRYFDKLIATAEHE